jgi:hypothetical protein
MTLLIFHDPEIRKPEITLPILAHPRDEIGSLAKPGRNVSNAQSIIMVGD